MKEQKLRQNESPDALALAYMPLGRKIARQYAGRGAEYEDLAQEAFLVLRELIVRHQAGERADLSLGLFLWSRLRGRVRDAAARMRRGFGHDSLDQRHDDEGWDVPCEERGFDEFDLLSGLSADERRLARALYMGLTQKEVARMFAITQQGVSRRIMRLRAKVSAQLHS